MTDLKPCATETGWLVEKWDSRADRFEAEWWSIHPSFEDGCGWTKDSTIALRFARECDATAYIEDIGWTEAKATEHSWPSIAHPTAPDDTGEGLRVARLRAALTLALDYLGEGAGGADARAISDEYVAMAGICAGVQPDRAGEDEALIIAGLTRRNNPNAESLAASLKGEQGEAVAWRAMKDAPRDGTEIETLCVHRNAMYSADAWGDGWATVARVKWIDHNGGGWTWEGLCGVHIAWRPVTVAAPPSLPEREEIARIIDPEAMGASLDLPSTWLAMNRIRERREAALAKADAILARLNHKPEGEG